MIKKTMTITSLAILIAAISVATSMTMVKADPTNDLVDINIPTATLTDLNVAVGGGVEYTSTMPVVDAELTFTDGSNGGTLDGIVESVELVVTTEGVNVPNGVFSFPAGTTAGEVTFTDANADKSVQSGELDITEPGVGVFTPATASITADPKPITVDIDAGTVLIDLTAGSPDTNDIVVTISDIQWVGETGAIGSFACSLSDGADSTPLFSKDTLQVTISSVVIDQPIDFNCEFVAFHGELDKTLLDPCDSEGLEVKRSVSQQCTFNVTYEGARATIIDTLPAEWEEDPVVFTDDDGKCSVDEDVETGNKGKNKKDNNKSATGITCEDVGESADFDVTVTTRESPGKGHAKKGVQVFKPTSCPTIDVNSGAKAILLDENGVPVLGTLDGLPIVLDSTDPLPVDVVDNETQDIPCSEA
jgi:hypothetical protein